ncbi:MAG: LEA type 2 family protein [Prevotellaceae bacterium]|jgi:LEA14-like dessication related protein|nr:LEA type 2 family protein [Prevotellaceae bacterium]
MKDSTLILGGLGLLWLFNKGKKLYNNLNNLRFGLDGLHIVNFDSTAQTILLNIDFKIFNPYNITLMFYEIDAQIFFNDKAVGNIKSAVNRYIYANSTSIIPMSITLNYSDLGTELWEHITSGGRIDDWRINIKGTVNVQNINIPLALQFIFQDFVSGTEHAVRTVDKAEILHKLIDLGLTEKQAKNAMEENYLQVLSEKRQSETDKIAKEIFTRWQLMMF